MENRFSISITNQYGLTETVASALYAGPHPEAGRLKTVILSAGFLIRPEEIDEAMRRHPNVIASATLAMADGTFEKVPMPLIMGDAGLMKTP